MTVEDAQRALEALQEEAASATTVAVQEAVAVLLGAPPEIAVASVARAQEEGQLGHGIALLGLVAASRTGADVVAALDGIAGGATVPAGWSSYEVRVALQEASEEAETRLRHLTSVAPPLEADSPRGIANAAAALRAGRRPDLVTSVFGAVRRGSSLESALVEQTWLRVVWSRAGGVVRVKPPRDPAEAWAEEWLAGGAQSMTPPEGLDGGRGSWIWRGAGVLTRAEDYLDPFGG